MKARRMLRNNPTPNDEFPDPPHTPASKISVNDDLTKMKANAAYEARQLKRSGKITNTWVHDGKVMIELLNKDVKRIKHVSEFNKYIPETPGPPPVIQPLMGVHATQYRPLLVPATPGLTRHLAPPYNSSTPVRHQQMNYHQRPPYNHVAANYNQPPS